MTGVTTKDNLFRPTRTRAESKAEVTDRTARAIIDAEVQRREAKTEKLRQARIASEERDPPEPAPAKKPKRAKAPASRAKKS